MAAIPLLTVLICAAGALLAWASRRWQPDADTIVDAIDNLLPQTQCAQCGYPGCRPYAQAVARGAAVNLCPPGVDEVHSALVELLGKEHSTPPQAIPPQTARIDESQCIGCFLCVDACPVDAILGAPRYVHTVIQDSCTGCELCIDPCPVDCIELEVIPLVPAVAGFSGRRWPELAEQACIRCGQCEVACPVALTPQQMLWFGSAARPDNNQSIASAKSNTVVNTVVKAELIRCIECGLCNQVCPSNIDLVGEFRHARRSLTAQSASMQRATTAKARFDKRQHRHQERQGDRKLRRGERLAERSQRQWPT